MIYNTVFAQLMNRLSTAMSQLGEPMRAKAYKTAEESILSMTEDIRSVQDLANQPGIGPTIKTKLQEYLETGKIKALEEYENKPEIKLAEIYGIGPKKAKELVAQGITTIDELRARPDLLNAVQKKGIQYYEDILKRIPRKEIDLYDKHLKVALKSFPESKYEIVGSYRREQSFSGDIDIIFTSNSAKTFDGFLDKLIENKIIVEVLSRGKHKCLVMAKIPESETYRRVDFLFAPPEEYAFSILYFTGSKGFNVVMRGHALKKGFSLNEHGFTPSPNETFLDEPSIFRFLGLEYKTPIERTDGRAVVSRESSSALQISQHTISEMELEPEPVEKEQVVLLKKTRKKREPNTKKKSSRKTPSKESLDSQKMEPEPLEEPKVLLKKSRKKREPKTKKTSLKSPPSNIAVPCGEPEPIIEETKSKPSDKKSIKPSSPKSVESMDKFSDFKERGMTVLEELSETELENMIEVANAAYYNETPVLTDNEFDILREFTAKKYPKNEAVCKIGAPIQGKNKVSLPYEMPSMDKIKPDSGALAGWMAKYTGPYVLSCKLDGVSGLYVCSQKGEYKLYTRGDGCVGQDISHLISVLRLPKLPQGMAVRGEFILPKTVFAEKYAAEFANARNLVSGIINRKTVDEKAKDLHFVSYEVIEPLVKPSEQMRMLTKAGLSVVQYQCQTTLTNEYLSDLLVDWRKTYSYEIDGVIVIQDSIHQRESGNPDYAFAFKMVLSDQMAEAKVVDVLWEASKAGYLKPRVRIEPIGLGGVTIEYATGFNGKFIEDNKIGVGAVIQMVRSGDVIPFIKSVSTPAEKAKMPLVPYVWNKTHVDVLLENPAEDVGVQEKNITLFFTSLEVDGLAKGNVHKLFQAGKTSVAQILRMTPVDFETIEGFQKKTATKLAEGIKAKVAAASLLDIMVASGKMGRGLGERKIRPILAKYPDILRSPMTPSEKEAALKSIEGIGPENAREFVKNIPSFMEFVKACGLESKLQQGEATAQAQASAEALTQAPTVQGPLTGKKIVMTKVRDKEVITFMTNQGASLEDSMKKDTFVLIVKSKEDTSNKTEYAVKNGIPIMTVEEFKGKYMV
jgi:NAD-dependent DNA ligase/DNA polymerase/3'-5' exonuclease PolX